MEEVNKTTELDNTNKKLHIFDVSNQSKHLVGDLVRTKINIDKLLKIHTLYLKNDNTGIEEYLGRDCYITKVVYDTKDNYYRYLIDIDDGDFWWVDECFD